MMRGGRGERRGAERPPFPSFYFGTYTPRYALPFAMRRICGVDICLNEVIMERIMIHHYYSGSPPDPGNPRPGLDFAIHPRV